MSHPLQDASVTAAFAMLIRDARAGEVSGVSSQTLCALSSGMSLRVINLVSHRGPLFFAMDASLWFVTISTGFFCSYMVAKATDAGNEDEIFQTLSRRSSISSVYVMAACMTLVAMLVACHCSVTEAVGYVRELPTALTCTFENFLHGTALLPQLILSWRRGFVAPAALKLLLILGVKHIVELADDLSVSYQNFWAGTLNIHEASFLSGDLFAAAVLLDFLYLFVTSRFLQKESKVDAFAAATDILALRV